MLRCLQELIDLTDEHEIQEHLVDACMDADDPKGELIKLLCDGTAPAVSVAVRKDGKPMFNGTRWDGWGKAAMCKAAATVDNDMDAQYWLGRRFMDGRTVRQDTHRGLIWLRKAAAAGSYPAQCHLGKYFNQRHVAQLRVAAGGKYPTSAREMARMAKRNKAMAKAEQAEKQEQAALAHQETQQEFARAEKLVAQKAADEKKVALAAFEQKSKAEAEAAAEEAEEEAAPPRRG